MVTIPEPTSRWSLLEPDVHTRKLDSLEALYASLANIGVPWGREQWAITSAVKLSFPSTIADPVAYLKRAWDATRTFNPILGATLSPSQVQQGDRVMILSERDRDSWIESTFHVENNARNAGELFSKLNTTHHGMHWLPSSSEVLVRLSHWKIDGMGTIRIWGNFLDFLTTFLREGLQAKPVTAHNALLTRSAGDLVGSSTDDSSTPSYLNDGADRLINLMLEGIPSMGPPVKPGSVDSLPGATKRCSLTLDEACTNAVITACKKKNVSVSAMIHAALIRVLATYPQHPLSKSMSTIVAVDLRRFLPQPYNKTSQAAGAFACGRPLLVNDIAAKDFEQIARETNAVYRLDFTNLLSDDKGRPVSLVELSAPFARRVARLFATPPPPEFPPLTTPSVSSLGVLENYIQQEYECGAGEGQKLVVEDFFLGSEQLFKDMWCHVVTFRGKLTIPMVFNEAFHEVSSIYQMLEKVKIELLKGLGIGK